MGMLIDIGGTNIRFGFLGQSKNRPDIVRKTPRTKDEILKLLLKEILLQKSIYKRKLNTVVISCPGLITYDGTVAKAIYIPLSGVRLKDYIKNACGCEVIVENDANIQALGKFKVNNLLYMVIGTAVGGAYISNGKIFKGYNGFACEFGHIFTGGNDQCYCGNIGCLDTYISGQKFINLFGENWWEKKEDVQIDDYIIKAGNITGKALAFCSILFDPGELFLCGKICENKMFTNAVSSGFKKVAWDQIGLSFGVDTWQYAYLGAMKLVSKRSNNQILN